MVSEFLAWCEDHRVPSIAAVQPVHGAGYIGNFSPSSLNTFSVQVIPSPPSALSSILGLDPDPGPEPDPAFDVWERREREIEAARGLL
jgi:hypothetical protein